MPALERTHALCCGDAQLRAAGPAIAYGTTHQTVRQGTGSGDTRVQVHAQNQGHLNPLRPRIIQQHAKFESAAALYTLYIFTSGMQ